MISSDKQTQPKRALGRGLSALIPQANSAGAVPVNADLRDKGIHKLAIENIRRDVGQPRKFFDEARLKELADSIQAQGVIQPVLVRKEPQGGYVLIAGERRWRAAQLAGLKEIPAIVRDVLPEVLQFALAVLLAHLSWRYLEKRLLDFKKPVAAMLARHFVARPDTSPRRAESRRRCA